MARQKLPSSILKHLDFKIFSPENKKFRDSRVSAPKDKAYTPQGMQAAMSITLMELERLFPESEYTIVKTGKQSVSFTWVKYLNEDEKKARAIVLAARENAAKGVPAAPAWHKMLPGATARLEGYEKPVEVLDVYLEDGKPTVYKIKLPEDGLDGGRVMEVAPETLTPIGD